MKGFTSHVNIEREYLHQYLENNHRVQILSGGRFEHGNRKEYAENMEVYLKELSEYELKTSLKDFKYKVTWKDLWGRQNQIIFYLKDYFK